MQWPKHWSRLPWLSRELDQKWSIWDLKLASMCGVGVAGAALYTMLQHWPKSFKISSIDKILFGINIKKWIHDAFKEASKMLSIRTS